MTNRPHADGRHIKRQVKKLIWFSFSVAAGVEKIEVNPPHRGAMQ